MTRLFRPCHLLIGLALLAAGPAQAQSSAIRNFTENPEADRQRVVRKPIGVPGARAGAPAPAAPSERLAGEMAPNEALFDSVNRGDVAAARDALSRGADVEARNILGLTAVELAIDLGRNEMTFLLLSMRGAAPAPPPAAEARAAAPARPAPARAAAGPVRAPSPAPVRAPRLRSADAGTPVPPAGFLGFGSAPR
jgi:hypothetical protein